jgi:myo-inositol-1(or 4)-monophosphatase
MVVRWQTERDAAAQAARQAGRVLLEWSDKFTIQRKGVGDFVTEADHAAQESIRKRIARQFPDDDFVGEEGSAPGKNGAARRWIVDPLDGTFNYTHGFSFYCVSIALEVEGVLVAGAIYDPVRQECFSAGAGGGADCNGAPIHVSSIDVMEDALLCAGFPINEYAPATRAFIESTRRSWSVRRLGSAALALAYVAAGRAESFWAHKIQAWDVAAGALLVAEAGGVVTHLDGARYGTAKGEILGTNGLVHQQVQAALAETM